MKIIIKKIEKAKNKKVLLIEIIVLLVILGSFSCDCCSSGNGIY